ncbi:MAG TPA: zinc-ribbon domain-containing protein [Stellaceae bacterium]|nr:zinc-ribbon domain-containing protein [Stellaceae bacterium]
MIVTCTSCSKRYLVDARALGMAGRNVRCANCGHSWFQTPPADAPQLFELPLAAAPDQAPDFASARRDARVQLPAVRRSSARGQIIGWSAAAIAIVVLAWGLIAARAEIVGLWPPAGRLYALAGYGPAVAGTGLELRKVTPSRGSADGVPTLAVDGEVVNVSTVARDVPKLKIALRDGNDKELQAMTIAVTDQRLLPGASVPFHTVITRPNEAATGVVVSFSSTGP